MLISVYQERSNIMYDDIINILNLNHSDVQSCSSKNQNNCISYFITLIRKEFICPYCLHKLSIKDYHNLTLSHQIMRGYDTHIIYRKRRYYCPQCKTYHYENNPFTSQPYSRFTDASQIQIMILLKEHSTTFSMVARQFHTTPTKIINIFDTFGQMKKLPFTEVICIDEFYWNRKSKNKYACAIFDFSTGNIIDIIEGRKLKNWDSYTQLIKKDEFKKVKYICTDLFETYRQVQKIYFPHALLCWDSFHIIKNINILLKNERIKLMKKYEKNSIEYYLLKHFHFLLMIDSSKIKENKAKYNHKLKRYINYPQLLELILDINPILKEAYNLKELYLIFNSISSIEDARINLSEVIREYSSSNIESYRKLSITLIEWFEEIINSFILYKGKRISNGKIEGTNSRIKTILKNANGFKNFSRMRNRIMYCINKKSLPSLNAQSQIIRMPGRKRGKYNKKQ